MADRPSRRFDAPRSPARGVPRAARRRRSRTRIAHCSSCRHAGRGPDHRRRSAPDRARRSADASPRDRVRARRCVRLFRLEAPPLGGERTGGYFRGSGRRRGPPAGAPLGRRGRRGRGARGPGRPRCRLCARRRDAAPTSTRSPRDSSWRKRRALQLSSARRPPSSASSPATSRRATSTRRGARGLLVLCGSYVPTTTRQLAVLLDERPGTWSRSTFSLLSADDAEREIERAAERAPRISCERGRVAVVATPRERPEPPGRSKRASGSPKTSRVVAALDGIPDVVLAKGGITSAVTLRVGLGATTAFVVGPVRRRNRALERSRPGRETVAYIVFPGTSAPTARSPTSSPVSSARRDRSFQRAPRRAPEPRRRCRRFHLLQPRDGRRRRAAASGARGVILLVSEQSFRARAADLLAGGAPGRRGTSSGTRLRPARPRRRPRADRGGVRAWSGRRHGGGSRLPLRRTPSSSSVRSRSDAVWEGRSKPSSGTCRATRTWRRPRRSGR